MYSGHDHLCVCLCLVTFPHYCVDPDVTWKDDRGFPLVVHYYADLQLMHGFRCYDNIYVYKLIALYATNAYNVECEMSASSCACCMPGCICSSLMSRKLD